ncbi:relaxase/mobilization nuclease domain-containing protein [Joostella sp. CR20]|uniref:relaxase/mobilization nuclease domain-containing protein n=1 Tax=Joostella sp. CR20 TaxID=2804312 RepID=UPI00313DC382
MIGKGKSIAHTQASMLYGWNEEKGADIVYRQHLVGVNPNELTKEFKLIQQLNEKCHKNTLSFVISPTIEDGTNISTNQLREITRQFIKKMKLESRQGIAFVHRDKAHTHIHLYVNRIDFRGKAYKDNFIGKKSQLAAANTAKTLGFKTVKDIQLEKLEPLKNIQADIKKIHEHVIFKYKPKSFDQYINRMANYGVKVIPSINKSNQLQGFRFSYKNINLKGSEVHRSMSGGKIAISISNNSNSFLKKGEKSIQLLGKVLQLNPNIIQSIILNSASKVLKKTIENNL